MKLFLLLLASLIITSAAYGQSNPASSFSSGVARSWFDLELVLIRTGTGFSPPVAARALGYSGLALYEALVSGIPGNSSLSGRIPQYNGVTPTDSSKTYHWPTVASNALAVIMDSLFGNASVIQRSLIDSLRLYYNTQFQLTVPAQEFTDSKDYGELVAREIFDFSRTDGGHKGYTTNVDTTYVPPVGPGLWVPTPPAFAPALQPRWGNNRPFVTGDTMTPVIPGDYPSYSTDSSSAFYAFASQVYSTVNNLTQGQINIARYWGDGAGTITPPGHSISILTQILKRENTDLAVASIAYATLGMSQNDAFIACWRTKYIYNLLRPVTYIRQNIDSTWSSLIGTPPFPEYTSGHSTQSGAMTSVMNNLFGAAYTFTDSTHGASYGGPRTFGSFEEAAYEAATSRLYGGIHYEFSDVLAISLGKMIGENINRLFEPVSGLEFNTGEEAGFTVYPNPARAYAMLSFNGTEPGGLKVYDLAGRLMFESGNVYAIDLSALVPGIYIIAVFDKRNIPIAFGKVIRSDGR